MFVYFVDVIGDMFDCDREKSGNTLPSFVVTSSSFCFCYSTSLLSLLSALYWFNLSCLTCIGGSVVVLRLIRVTVGYMAGDDNTL